LSFCTKCGYKLPVKANFCPSCGTPVPSGIVAPEKLKAGDEIEEPTQRMSDSSKIEKLIQDLKDRSRSVRQHATEELGKIGDERAVEPLIEVMNEDEIFVSIKAAKALGEIGGDRAVEALVKTMKEDTRSFEYSEYMQQYKDDVWVAQEAARALAKGKLAFEPLIKIVKEGDYWGFVAEALGERGDVRAIEPLIKALRYGNIRCRQALIKFGSRAFKPLVKALKDPNATVRKYAVELLGTLDNARAVKPLIGALKDEEADVRQQAALELNKIGGEEAEKVVKTYIEGLIKVLTHKKGIVRRKAASNLDKLGWKPKDNAEKIHYLIAKYEWDEVALLGETAIEPLTQVLEDESWMIRISAAEVLTKMGDDRGIELLALALKTHDEAFVRHDALKALRKIKDSRVVEPLIEALSDEDPNIQVTAIETLGEIGDARAIEPLKQALSGGWVLRGTITGALERIMRRMAIKEAAKIELEKRAQEKKGKKKQS